MVVQNAVAALLFVLGRADDAKWNEVKNRPATCVELACDKMIVSCPSEVACIIRNPSYLMEFWRSVVEAQDDFANQAAERKRPERIVIDVQIGGVLEMVTFGKSKFPGWFFYYEIGRNHQRGDLTFDGTGEVTNNVLGMDCDDAVLKKDWLIGHPAITEDERNANVKKILKTVNKWQDWKSRPFLVLTTYLQLVQEFGWGFWRKYLHSFVDEGFGPAPKGGDERRNQFLVRYSEFTSENLCAFFDAWGIQVSSSG